TTGVREAAVMAIEGDRWPKRVAEEPIVVKGVEDMFERMRAQPLRAIPSDDEKYDQMFPDHPLAKVRRRMNEVVSTLKVSAPAEELAPFKKSIWSRVLRGSFD